VHFSARMHPDYSTFRPAEDFKNGYTLTMNDLVRHCTFECCTSRRLFFCFDFGVVALSSQGAVVKCRNGSVVYSCDARSAALFKLFPFEEHTAWFINLPVRLCSSKVGAL
jgi:hypothetical protein